MAKVDAAAAQRDALVREVQRVQVAMSAQEERIRTALAAMQARSLAQHLSRVAVEGERRGGAALGKGVCGYHAGEACTHYLLANYPHTP
jgi:hypothetical protein